MSFSHVVKLENEFDCTTVARYNLLDLLDCPMKSGERVKKGVDGTHAQTVVVVYSQPHFATMTTDMIHDAVHRRDELQLIVTDCNTSFHRADTFARTLEATLNNILFDGKRAFNVMYSPTKMREQTGCVPCVGQSSQVGAGSVDCKAGGDRFR